MQNVYGARFEPDYQRLKKLNNQEVVKATRLTIFNDAYTLKDDQESYTGKKNLRFVIGGTQPPVTIDYSIYLFQPYVGNREFVKDILRKLGPDLNWQSLAGIKAKMSLVIFDARDRSLYLLRLDSGNKNCYHESTLFIDSKCNFSSEKFDESLELSENMVYKIDYLNRQLYEVEKLGEIND